jgi:TRAP-type C4-dicarboxylate transport system permease small subunit
MKGLLKIFDRCLNFLSSLAGVILIFIMLSVCLEVIMRYFFNRPLIWVTEVTECLLLYITFLGTAWLLREDGHVRVDIMLNRLRPRVAAFLGIVNSVIGSFVALVLTWYGAIVMWDKFQRNVYTPSIMEIPIAAIIVIIPVGSIMLLTQFILRTTKFVRIFVSGNKGR